MAMRKCDKQGCRSRNNRGVWLIDGKVRCTSCFEAMLETSCFDQHRIVRISDRDEDFLKSTQAPPFRPSSA